MSNPKSEYINELLNQDLDFRNRRLYINGDIEDNNVPRIIQKIHLLENFTNEPIEIWLNSEGGSVTAGFAIYDIIRSSPNTVRIVGWNVISSIASIIFLAADERILMPHCEFMIHPINCSTDGSHPDIKIDFQQFKRLETQLLDIYSTRTNKNLKFWQNIVRDRYLTVKECLSYGIAHEVIAFTD